MSESAPPPALACLSEQQRKDAMARLAILRPHLEQQVPLARAARQAGVAVRTAQRWLTRCRADGLAGLRRRENPRRQSLKGGFPSRRSVSTRSA